MIAVSLSYMIGVTAIALSLSVSIVISQALRSNETGTLNSLPATLRHTIDKFYNKDERLNFRCNPGCCSKESQNVCHNVTMETSTSITEKECLKDLNRKNIVNGFCCCCKKTFLVQPFGNVEKSIFNLNLGFSTGPGLKTEYVLVK